MKTSKLVSSVVLSVFMLGGVSLANAASTNLVQNGSFEADIQASGTWKIYQNLTEWTGGESGIELRNNVVGSAQDGVNFVELDTKHNSSMSQVITTQANQRYELSFWYQNRPGTSVGTNGLSWAFGGVTGIASIVNDFGVWHQFVTTVLSSSDSTALSFAAIGTDDSLGSSIDNVSLKVATPIPGAVWLFASGIAGLVGLNKRKKTI
jgi:hypothetical protein